VAAGVVSNNSATGECEIELNVFDIIAGRSTLTMSWDRISSS
jgi:hypothetical protein